eukprot:1044961-Pyramimonas_sp.AAC.1
MSQRMLRVMLVSEGDKVMLQASACGVVATNVCRCAESRTEAWEFRELPPGGGGDIQIPPPRNSN